MKRVLVTGGAGFIGSNLCARLAKDRENHIICLDDLSTGRLRNIKPLMSLPNFEFVEKDVQVSFDTPVDRIYNAACPASPPAYQKDPVNTTKTCVFGVLNMLELAYKYGARLLQFSTSEVYGEPEVHPQVESYRGNVNPIGIRSCYDEGKRCAESLCFDYIRQYGADVKVARIFNTYGPNMDPYDGRVVSNFIIQALRGDDITIYGDGSQTRSFQYIDDLLNGLILLMEETYGGFAGPVNIGNPHEFTVMELAEMILNKTGSGSRIVFKPLPADDPTRRRADITLAKNELSGWEPIIQLDEGLDRSIDYFRSIIQEL